LTVAVVVFFLAMEAPAQVARVFLSGTGDDLNDCSNAATPCRSLQGAINQSPANGEVIVLTSGGFGTANITKSLTINAPDGIVAFNARTINVAIGATDTVVIRGLSMNGAVFGDLYGIHFTAGGTLVVENSIVDGFFESIFQSAPGSRLIVNNCELRNGTTGMDTSAGSSTTTYFTANDSRFLNNSFAGVHASAAAVGVVKNSVISGNRYGFFFTGLMTGDPKVMIDHCVIAHNATANDSDGIRAQDFSGLPYDVEVRVTNSDIYGNTIGLFTANAAIVSYGTNHLWNNTTDGAFSSTVAQP
jgi:hypothetical protein